METSLALLPGDEVFLSVLAVVFVAIAASTQAFLAPLLVTLAFPAVLLIRGVQGLGMCSGCECQNLLIIGLGLFGVVLMIEGYVGVGTYEFVGALVSLAFNQLCIEPVVGANAVGWGTTLQDLVLAAGSSLDVTNVLKNAIAAYSA